jgi:signal transduction histidine kinase
MRRDCATSSVSHEIRAPLTRLHLFAETARDQGNDPKLEDSLVGELTRVRRIAEAHGGRAFATAASRVVRR